MPDVPKPTYEAKERLFRRMVELGWLVSYHNTPSGYFTIEPTELGQVVFRGLKVRYEKLAEAGEEMIQEDEIVTLFVVVMESHPPTQN